MDSRSDLLKDFLTGLLCSKSASNKEFPVSEVSNLGSNSSHKTPALPMHKLMSLALRYGSRPTDHGVGHRLNPFLTHVFNSIYWENRICFTENET